MMRHKGANAVELKGVSIKSLLELAVLSPFLPALLTFKRLWLLFAQCFCKQHYFEQGLLFPEMFIWHSRGQRYCNFSVRIGISTISPSTSKHRQLAMLPLFPNTSCAVAHSTLIHPASSHTPNSKHRDLFFLTCTSVTQENCAKASDLSPAKAKLQVNEKSSLFETYCTIFLVQPEEHDFWKCLSLASLPRDAILHL